MSAQPLYEELIDPAPLREPEEHREAPARTPLALLDAGPAKRRRLPFILLCLVLAVAAVSTVLVLNVSVSRTQYDLVSLRSQQQQIAQDNGALTEEINNRRAPQNLAKSAREQNMVPGGAPGVVNAAKGKVTAAAAPAAAEDADGKKVKDTFLLDAPLTPQERAAAVAKKQEEARKAQEAATAKANGKATAPSTTTTQDTTQGNAVKDGGTATSGTAKDTKPDTATPSAGTADTKQLNGGSIPAPQGR